MEEIATIVKITVGLVTPDSVTKIITVSLMITQDLYENNQLITT